MKKILLTTVLSLMMCIGVYAQDYLNAPKANEKELGTLSAKECWHNCENNSKRDVGHFNGTKLNWYTTLLETAEQKYPGKTVDIRNLEVGKYYNNAYGGLYCGPATGKVVWVMSKEDIANEFNKTLSQALNKALRNVHEGSRLAIDQVTVISSMDRGEFKDQLIDILLDKGYKIVAKDYLERLYEEQQAQQSGIYNESTTVKADNFSAVGYYINVKVTETSLRVQVVNVSTGEYEGNATVNF